MTAWRRFIASLFGAGFLPGAPGAWGTLAAAVLFYVIAPYAGWQNTAWVGVIIFSALCVAIGHYAESDFGRKDPPSFVLDEGAGLCLTLLYLPPARPWITLVAAFLAFRLFDVTKPPPARQLEKLPRGWGILLDDLAAGVYANLLCQVVLRLLH